MQTTHIDFADTGSEIKNQHLREALSISLISGPGHDGTEEEIFLFTVPTLSSEDDGQWVNWTIVDHLFK